MAAETPADWRSSGGEEVTVTPQADGSWQIKSTVQGEYTVESAQNYPAGLGDCFAIDVRVRAAIGTRALPELVCFDGQGREIPIPSSLARHTRFTTTSWQDFRRVFPAQPGTASVRARIRAIGRGPLTVAGLSFRPTTIDPYQTGALVSQPHPKLRTDIVLESNFSIVNRDQITPDDRDGDGKWAIIIQDLDALTAPDQKGEDWRSTFEDNPNVILWSDGVVLKSDSVHAERAPDMTRALHFRANVRPGPYVARVNDPGRPVAVSLDGKTWRRSDPGREIELGTLAAADGQIEFWIDACYVDVVRPGPAYFDYIRLTPTIHAPSVDRLSAAALVKPAQLKRGSAAETKVPIAIDEAGFAGLAKWPVRCGLPIPRGDLVSAANAAVLDPAGRKIPSQNRVMSSWPDGSIKWLYLDFMHELSRGAKASYTLACGNGVRSMSGADAVRIERSADGIEVDTGAIQFFVSGKRFGLMENVRLASGQSVQRKPISAEIVEAAGRTWRALDLPVTKLEVEQAGPLHAVILVETALAESGKPASGFFHRARIHAYAGSPLVQVDYFVANTDSRPAGEVGGSMASKVVVKSIALKVTPDNAITAAQHEDGGASSAGARVQSTANDLLEIDGAGRLEKRASAKGWLALTLGRSGSLQVGLADFREQFPKALRWTPEALGIELWSAEGGDYEWIEGIGKTHHLSLLYGDAAPGSGGLLAAGPVLATAAPEWYARSGAFGPISPAAQSGLPAVERTLDAHMKQAVIDRVGLGFENYGDHSSGGYVKGSFLWDNNEYDLPAGCVVHFARTGNRAALRLGLASALHYLDVDTIHYSSEHADWARAQRVHSHGLFGHHSAQGPDFNHAGYVQGLIWYSYFTGDPAGIAGARGIADWCLRNLSVHTHTMERYMGHPMMTLTDVYEATGEVKYLRGAAQLVDQALKWEDPARGGFRSPITESSAFYSGSSFNTGVLSAPLIKFNSWARLPEIDALLERFARWVLTDMWKAPAGLVNKGGSPRRPGEPRHIANHGRLMAYVYECTKDPMFIAVPWTLTTLGFGENTALFGTRQTGLVYNYLPWFITELGRHGNPEPEPSLETSAGNEKIVLAPAAVGTVRFILRNTGKDAIEQLEISFVPRLDFTIAAAAPLPRSLAAGQSVECVFKMAAPSLVNLTSVYNRNAYAHFSALYKRSGRAHLAHRAVSITLE